MRPRAPWPAVLGLALWLAACAPSSTTPGSLLTPLPPLPSETATAASATATDAPSPAPTATGTLVVQPTVSATSAGRPSPARGTTTRTATPEPPCANDAEFLADLTVPDGAQFLPGQTFVKRWSVKNAGTCDWGPGYRLVFVSGEALTATPGSAGQTEFALYPARAGTQAVWEVAMRAPDAPGEYLGRWQARDPQGNLFGGVVFVEIEVIPLPATP
jgi:next-to-BRCA1 protein 1